jgi:hypothetical protein
MIMIRAHAVEMQQWLARFERLWNQHAADSA